MAQETNTSISSLEQMHANSLREALQARAGSLRRIADTFDRIAGDVSTTNRYSQLAASALHELTWGIANLNVERIVNEAGAADVARAKGE